MFDLDDLLKDQEPEDAVLVGCTVGLLLGSVILVGTTLLGALYLVHLSIGI